MNAMIFGKLGIITQFVPLQNHKLYIIKTFKDSREVS